MTKKSDWLELHDSYAGDEVLPAGPLLYNWVRRDAESNYAQKLVVGSLRVISTPVCTPDGERQVPFGQVTYNTLKAGVTRPLDFKLNCVTDYGEYKVTATITAETRTADGLIKVTDKAGNADRMKIRIKDSNNNFLPATGIKGETKQGISGIPAEFNWSATLLPGSSAELPEDGDFRATAEIMLIVS